MENLKLLVCKWDELDLDEVSEFIYDNRVGIYKGASDSEGVKRHLSNIQERFPAEAIFMASRKGELCGWVALDRESESVAELGRWQPIVKKSDSEEEIVNLILKGVLDYAVRTGITRIESMFSEVSKDNDKDYEKSAKWFISNGFPKLEDNAYMTMQLESKDIESRSIPDGLTIESLESADYSDLYECYYESFVTGEDRDFLDMNDKQRKEKFDKSLHSHTINQHLSSVLKDGEKIVGFSFVLSRDNEEHVDRFGIRKAYRGKGLAKAHLLHVVRSAKEAGTPMVSIGVDTINSSAFNLYKNVGFEVDSRMIVHTWNLN